VGRSAKPLTADQCATLSTTRTPTMSAPTIASPATSQTGYRRQPTAGTQVGTRSPHGYTRPSVNEAAAIDATLSPITYAVP
jgi:hypothetical protein